MKMVITLLIIGAFFIFMSTRPAKAQADADRRVLHLIERLARAEEKQAESIDRLIRVFEHKCR